MKRAAHEPLATRRHRDSTPLSPAMARGREELDEVGKLFDRMFVLTAARPRGRAAKRESPQFNLRWRWARVRTVVRATMHTVSHMSSDTVCGATAGCLNYRELKAKMRQENAAMEKVLLTQGLTPNQLARAHQAAAWSSRRSDRPKAYTESLMKGLR